MADSEVKNAESAEMDFWGDGDFVGEAREATGAATIEIEKDSKTYNFSPNQEDLSGEASTSANNNDDDDTSSLIKTEKHAVWSFAYYQQFFDVNTDRVVENIKDSMIPLPSLHHSHKYFGGKADLYGPVWICATLVVALSVFGNLNTVFNEWSRGDTYVYTPQFERVSIAGLLVFSYSFLVPALVYAFIRWKSSGPFDFYVSDYISSYGYSLFALIPTSVLMLIRNDVFSAFLLITCLCVSGGVLALRLWNTLQHLPKQIALIVTLLVVALHVALLVSVKVYFFTHSHVDTAHPSTAVPPTTLLASTSNQTLTP